MSAWFRSFQLNSFLPPCLKGASRRAGSVRRSQLCCLPSGRLGVFSTGPHRSAKRTEGVPLRRMKLAVRMTQNEGAAANEEIVVSHCAGQIFIHRQGRYHHFFISSFLHFLILYSKERGARPRGVSPADGRLTFIFIHIIGMMHIRFCSPRGSRQRYMIYKKHVKNYTHVRFICQ